MGHISTLRIVDDNVRMILPPSSMVAASIVYTYTVKRIKHVPTGMTFDGTHIHIADALTTMFG